MAPSPELGQPKAPDKVDNKVFTLELTTNFGTQQRDHTKSPAAAAQPDTENLGSWDDGDLKKLLDEAITYKRPKDREHKSEIFKELLQHAELEDQARDCYSNRVLSRSARGSNRHTQGGSLQDLVETVQNEHLLDADFVIGGQSRRHHHNSRQKKYSLVSSRQREGGSLPSNVNVPFCNLCPYEEPFLNEFNKRKNINDKNIVHSGSGASRPDGNIRDESQLTDGKISHTVIEIGDAEGDETRHLLAHDSLAQGIAEPLSGDEGTELNPMKKLPRVAMNYTTHQFLNVDVSVGEASRSAHSIDKTVQFSALMKNNSKSLDMNTVQLNNSYVAVNSCMDSKAVTALTLGSSQNGKFATYPHGIQKHIDENGNSVQSFNSSIPQSSQPNKLKNKNKINKADRNTKTLIAKEIKGNRGNDNIESLLAFIENKETTRKNGVINVNKNVLNGDKNKKKNSTKKETGGNNKLKKSNSLEELKSSSKLEEEIAQSECVQESVVTLRHKQQAKKTIDMKENNKQQQQQKRGERRSWGTEELTYLGETNCIPKEEDINTIRDKDVRKTKDHTKSNKKKDDHSLSIVSIESISTSSETAEFHVVTKKKKAKKRQILEEARQKQMNHNRDQSSHVHGNRGKYHPSHNYTNDRDVYLNPFNSTENRRKSTSSVPPSEKSDSSDLDSVHSLPVESSTRLTNVQKTSTSSGSTPQASYADIARISNLDKNLVALPMVKWPVVSSKNPESPDNSNISTCSSLSAKSQVSVRANVKCFSEPIEISNAIHDGSSCSSTSSSSTIVKQISYSQSLTEDKPLIATNEDINKRNNNIVLTTKLIDVGKSNSDTTKNPLQKSKSVDNDNYVNMNIDNYPALEKTVKPQKQYQSLPAVEIPKPIKPIKMSPTTNPTNTVKPLENNICTSRKVNKQTVYTSNASTKDGVTVKQNQIEPIIETNISIEKQIADQNNVVNNKPPQVTNYNVSIDIPLISTTKKSTKKEKNHHNTQNDSATGNRHYSNSIRPAVIILNDNNSHGDNVSPLLFGDFNEDELRLLEQESDQQFVINHTNNKNPTQEPTDIIVTSENLTSPQSDLGYASSHNRSTLSTESLDVVTLNTNAINHHSSSSFLPVDNIGQQLASNQSITNFGNCSGQTISESINNKTSSCSSSSSNSMNWNHTDETLNQSAVTAPIWEKSVTREKELTVRFIAPPVITNIHSYNHDKIVNFVEAAWEDIICGVNGNAQFYSGQ